MGASRDAAQGRAPWVTGIGNLEIRPRDEGERLKNETHAGSEESAVLKAASLLERRPLRPGSPSRGHRNHLPFAGHLRPGAEPRVPASSVAAVRPALLDLKQCVQREGNPQAVKKIALACWLVTK